MAEWGNRELRPRRWGDQTGGPLVGGMSERMRGNRFSTAAAPSSSSPAGLAAQNRSRRFRLFFLALLLVIIVSITLIGGRIQLQGPQSATIGATIRVTASGLRSGEYSVLLIPARIPHTDRYCAAVLRKASAPVTNETVQVTIPLQIPCFTGVDSTPAGSVSAAGADELLLGVQSHGGFSPRYSTARRPIRIRPA